MELKQFKILGGSRNFEIISKEQLRITFSTMSVKNIELIDLYNLENKYERIVYRELKWLVGAFFLSIVACKFIYDAILLADSYPINAAIFFIALTCMCFLAYKYTHNDQIIFRLYQSSEPGLLIWAKKPTEAEAYKFADELVKAIDKLKIPPDLTPTQKLEVYAQHLSFLCDEGVISEKEGKQIYERSEKKLTTKKENVVSLVK